MTEHKRRTETGPVHAMDCPGCIEERAEREARYAETNPHRKGTKAWAKRDGEDRQALYALDMRYEHYWQS